MNTALTPQGVDGHGAYGYHWSVSGVDPLAFGHSGSDGTMAVAIPSTGVIVLYFIQSRGNDTMSEWLEAARKLELHHATDAK